MSFIVSYLLTHFTGVGGKGVNAAADNGDISTIIKLSNKLQEMVHANENMTRVNAALRRVSMLLDHSNIAPPPL